MNLRASWVRTATHLREARSELPEAPVPGTEGGTVESFEEYLDHNELELALDELEGLAPDDHALLVQLASSRIRDGFGLPSRTIHANR